MLKTIGKGCFILSLLLPLSSCLQEEILDEVNLIEGIGFDYAENGEIKGTVMFPVFFPNQKPKTVDFSAKSKIKKTMLQDVQRQLSDPIVTGSIELVLFSKRLATERGILELVDAFQRDPSVGSGIHIAIVDGEAKELMAGEYGIRGNATHISNLIETNLKREDLPKTNMHRFLFDFYLDGKTPYLPQIKQLSKDIVVLNGVCFFSNGKIIHTISPHEMLFFKLLVDKYSEGLHQVNIEEGKAAVQSIRSSNRFQMTRKKPYEIVIHIKVNGIINEYTGNELSNKDIKKLEKAFEKEINAESMKLINEFREKRLDPIGFGKFVKTQTRDFDIKKWWDSDYDQLTVKVRSDVSITEEGVIH